MPLAGKVGAVFLQTEEQPDSFIKEATTANAQRNAYTIENEECRYLDKNSTVTVYMNDEVITGGYEVQHLGGVIIFSSPLEPEDEVTVSGKSVQVDQAGGFLAGAQSCLPIQPM